MNSFTHEVPAILRYWRKSLADADRKSLRVNPDRQNITLATVRSGVIPPAVSMSLHEAWKRHKARAKRQDALADGRVPVVIALLALSK
jgi:hypothetical protein